jgi:hypothetical protein
MGQKIMRLGGRAAHMPAWRMTGRKILAVLLAAAVSGAVPAPAQGQAPQKPIEVWSDSLPAEAVERVTVTAEAKGPAIWRLTRGQGEVWILGTIGPMPEDLAWNKAGLQRLIAGARQVLLPPAPDVGMVDAAWFYLWHGDMLRQPDGRTLQQTLPEPLAARFATAAALTGKDASGYAGDVPLVAAMRLQRDFLSARDLDRREPRQTVERLARRAHVPVRRMGEFDLMPTVRAVLALPESRQRPCLEQAVDDTFRQARDAAAAAEAWADGDIAGVEAHYAETKLLECVAAVSPQAAGVNALSVELIVKAIDKALAEGGKSAAVISIGPLLRQGGVLEQLAAQGVTISQPQ